MIDVKQATTEAAKFMVELLPTVSDILLEEVELSEDDKSWRVTLSALAPASPPPDAFQKALRSSSIFALPTDRIYKVFTIDSENGVVRSMKMRTAS